MAYFSPSETPTDDAFKRLLTPLVVASEVQSGLSMIWRCASKQGRSSHGLADGARRVFDMVEQWWLKLADRSGTAIIAARQEAFGPSKSFLEQAKTAKIETTAAWYPPHAFAEAIFWAWLLQPEQHRTPLGTAKLVRQILERQLQAATEDIAAFSEFNGSGGSTAA